jgi:hypothetical protein
MRLDSVSINSLLHAGFEVLRAVVSGLLPAPRWFLAYLTLQP